MGWGMGNDFKEATQAATPDLARAYALQGQLDNTAQARVDAVRANNAAGIIGLGEKGFSEYKDWKKEQPIKPIKPIQMGGPLQGLAPYQAPNTGVLPDGYNMESMISDFGSGAAPTPSPASLAPSQDMQAPDFLSSPSQDMQMPDGFSDGVTPQYNSSAAISQGRRADFENMVTRDGNMFGRNVGKQFGSLEDQAVADALRTSTENIGADSLALGAEIGADISADIGTDVAADVAEDATLDAASTALDGLGGKAGVSAIEGILSGDDAGTIAKDVALDAGQAALLSALGLSGPLGWGAGALISALRA